MRKRLRKKLRVGEFQTFSFPATVGIKTVSRWAGFTADMAEFMSNRWRSWSFGYGEATLERRFRINVGVRDEAELRRLHTIQWLERRDDVQLIEAGPVDYKYRVHRLRRRRN